MMQELTLLKLFLGRGWTTDEQTFEPVEVVLLTQEDLTGSLADFLIEIIDCDQTEPLESYT